MSFENLLSEKRLQRHRTSSKEIGKLLAKAERDLSDARVEATSLDGRFMAAYRGALALATVALVATGYRVSGQAQHVTVFEALPLAMGEDLRELSQYLDTCRQKRNRAAYDEPGLTAEGDVEEIIEAAQALNVQVRNWLSREYSELLGEA